MLLKQSQHSGKQTKKNYLQDPVDDPGYYVKATWEALLLAHAWRIFQVHALVGSIMVHFSLDAFATADAQLLCSFVLFALHT